MPLSRSPPRRDPSPESALTRRYQQRFAGGGDGCRGGLVIINRSMTNHLAPPPPPSPDRARTDPKALAQRVTASTVQPLGERTHEHHQRAQIHPTPEESYRWRRCTTPAALTRAAQTQAVPVIRSEHRACHATRLARIARAMQNATAVWTVVRAHLRCQIFVDSKQNAPELGVREIPVQHGSVSVVLVDNGDNLLGELLASSLRGNYPCPLPNLNKFSMIPITQLAHAQSSDLPCPHPHGLALRFAFLPKKGGRIRGFQVPLAECIGLGACYRPGGHGPRCRSR